MVILLSALAVVVAAVLLVTWIVVQGGFVLIYASMAFAVLSMVLLWAARWMGSSPEPVAADGPEPLPALDAPAADGAEEEAEVATEAVERPPLRPRPAAPAIPAGFPIAEYDTLWVSQIVPLLPELDRDELSVVEARERGGRSRAAVLDAIAATRPAAPVVEEPVVEEPVAEEPAAAPVVEEPVVEELVAEEPAAAEPEEPADDDWLHDDRGPLDWPAVVAEGTDGWDAPEPDEWDWSAVRGDARVPAETVVVDDPTPAEPVGEADGAVGDEPDDGDLDDVDLDDVDLDDVVPNEAATVRMFLGRRRSTVTVRRT